MSQATASAPFARAAVRKTGRKALVAALTATMLLGACSSTDKSGDSSAGSSADSAAAIAAATKLLDQAKTSAVTGPSVGATTADQIEPWTADSMPKPSTLPKGKQISVDIVYGLPVGEVPYQANLLATLATKIGWKAKVVRATGQDQPSTLTAVQQALLDKPTAIITLVIPGVWVAPALAQAKSRGIVTVDIHQDDSTGPGYSAWVPASEGIQKSLMAAFAIQQSKGDSKSILFDAPGFSDANMPAAASYFKTCSSCEVVSKQFNPTEFTDPVKVQSGVTATLAANPGTNYLLWPNASLPIQPVITAIRSSTSKSAKLLVNGMGPVPIGLVKQGTVPLLVELPVALLDLIALDDVSRLVQGQKPLAQDALRVPISYWTPDTVPDAKDFSAITQAQLKNDFLAPYESAWGVSLRDTMLRVTR